MLEQDSHPTGYNSNVILPTVRLLESWEVFTLETEKYLFIPCLGMFQSMEMDKLLTYPYIDELF